MKNKHRKIFLIEAIALSSFLIGIFAVIISNFKLDKLTTYDVSKNRSMQAVNLVSKYKPEEVKTVVATSFNDVLKKAKKNPVSFKGTITGYGPDCVGCSGVLSCPPRHNASNGNIYFKDNEFGKIRILAGDSKIPCGTIVKVSLANKKPFYGIVLDRGGAIKGTLFDLLYAKESDATSLGRQNVDYTIVRWGW